MKSTPCQKAFNNGQAWRRTQRKTHSMQFSRYKIVETGERWSDYPTELRNIGLCASGDTSACSALRHCGQEDKSTWVKHLPESMLEDFSRNCVEVLYALHGDGVTQPTDNALHPMAALQQAKERRDAKTRAENKELQKQQRDEQQLKDLDECVGFSSDKILARYYDTARKTIWTWSADQDNPFPKSHKIGNNTTRWSNNEIKQIGCSL